MKKILMADDDKAFLSVVSRFLGQAGYLVVTARNGRDALALAAAEVPDMLVLDVALPFVTGDQIARQVTGEPPILFISGRDLDRLEGISGDRFRFLTKPADLDDILAHVQAMLGD